MLRQMHDIHKLLRAFHNTACFHVIGNVSQVLHVRLAPELLMLISVKMMHDEND